MEHIVRKMLIYTPAELERIGVVVDLVEGLQSRLQVLPFQGTDGFADIVKVVLGGLLGEQHFIRPVQANKTVLLHLKHRKEFFLCLPYPVKLHRLPGQSCLVHIPDPVVNLIGKLLRLFQKLQKSRHPGSRFLAVNYIQALGRFLEDFRKI